MTNDKKSVAEIPALFATIHFRSAERPNGYTEADIAELNERLNNRTSPDEPDEPNPA